MFREIARISSFHAYSIMTGSPQYLTILLIAKTTCAKVIIRRPLLGASFEDFEENFRPLSEAECHAVKKTIVIIA